MDDTALWEDFKKTGHIADYLRYRGVDIYAAQNMQTREAPPADANRKGQKDSTVDDRRTDYSGI